MSFKTSFKDGRLGIGLSTSINSGEPKYPLDINGDIRLTGAILKADGTIYTSGSGMGTPGIVSNQTNGLYKIGINNTNPIAALDVSGDVLPSVTEAFDLGSVDRRWRDVFVSMNSFWIGDEHKMSISQNGRMRFRKRKKSTLPKKIRNMAQFANAGTTADNHAKTVSVKGQTFTNISDMTMSDIVTYVRENVSGMENASVTDIWEGDDDEDYEDDNDIEGNMKISGDLQLNGTLKDQNGNPRIFSNWAVNGSDIYRSSGNVGIGTTTPGEKLSVNGSIQIKGSSNSTVTNESKLIFTRDLSDSDESEYIAQIYTANYAGPLILESGRGGGYVKAKGNSTSNHALFTVNDHNDSEKFRVCGNGRVGVGTTSPDHKLEIYESTGFVRLCMESSSTGKLLLGTHNDGRVFLYNEKNSYIHFGTNNSERMRIDNVGNVGIGETNPGAPLHITFTQSGDPTNNIKDMIKLETQFSTDFGGSYREGGSSILFYVENTTNQGLPGEAARIVAGCYETSSTSEYHSYLAFHTSNNSGSTGTNERMIIDDNGYVGIGWSQPGAKLSVNGKAYINDTNLAAPSTGTWGSNGARIVIWPGSSSGYPYAIGMNNNTMWFGVPVNQRFSWFFDATERMRMDAGNLTCTGDITAYGSISDLKLKRNIKDLDTKMMLDKVLQLKPVSFKWINDLENEKRRGKDDEGFIAQDVEKIWPMLVGEVESLTNDSNDKIKYIHYDKLTVYTTAAIQEQQKEINQLKDENKLLKRQIEIILERLNKLK